MERRAISQSVCGRGSRKEEGGGTELRKSSEGENTDIVDPHCKGGQLEGRLGRIDNCVY